MIQKLLIHVLNYLKVIYLNSIIKKKIFTSYTEILLDGENVLSLLLLLNNNYQFTQHLSHHLPIFSNFLQDLVV